MTHKTKSRLVTWAANTLWRYNESTEEVYETMQVVAYALDIPVQEASDIVMAMVDKLRQRDEAAA